MNKYWRLLAATTFLSAPAGLSAQAAGNDAPMARADREAGVLLAQAQGQTQIQGQPPVPEDPRKRNQNQQDNRKKQDDQNKAAEQQRKQQEDQAKRQADEQRKAAEQQQKQQAQDDKRKQEDQRKAAEQQQKQQAQDDKRKQDDQRKAAEQQQKQQAQDEKRKQEEEKKAAEQQRKAGEQQQKQQAQDEKRKQEDQRKATEQQQKQQAQDEKRKQEEQKKAADQQRKDEQDRRKQEDKQRAEDEKNRRATGQPGTSAPAVTSAGTVKPDQKEAKPIEATGGKGSGIKPQSAEGKEVKNLDELKKERREIKQGNRTILQELDRAIIKEGNRTIIRHDETDRFRYGAREVRRERRNDNTYVTIIVRPRGERIVNVVDENGFLIRRSRILADGREIIIIDNRPRPGFRVGNYFIVVPPPRIRIPRDRYIVELERAEPTLVYETLMAPPVDVVSRPYTLDEIRYNAPVRDRMPRIDLNTVTFESGSWDLTPEQVDKLAVIADGIKRALERNPQEVFMIEGYTDAVGDEDDNLSLSDRRAESVALAMTQQFEVPPENLTTQGYGEQNLKVPTDGPERANRRVTVRRITPLLMGQAQ